MAWRQEAAAANSGVSSINATLSVGSSGADVLAGSVLAGYMWWDNTTTTISSLVDSSGDTVTLLDNPTTDGVNRAALFYVKNATVGAHTLTFTLTGNAAMFLYVEERTGLDTSNPLDQHVMNGQSSPSTSTDAVTSTAKTTTVDGEDVCGYTRNHDNAGMNAGTGFTSRFNDGGRARFEDLIQGSAGSIAATFTALGTDNWITGMMTFIPPASGSPTTGTLTMAKTMVG